MEYAPVPQAVPPSSASNLRRPMWVAMRPSRRGHAQQRYHAFIAWSADSLAGRTNLVSVRLPSNTVKAAIPFPSPCHSIAVAWAMRQCSHRRSVVSTAEQRQRRVFHWFAHAPGTHTATVLLDRGGFLIWRHLRVERSARNCPSFFGHRTHHQVKN